MGALEDEDIGYGKPPKKTRFPKGVSGNPKGRPSGVRNMRTDLAEELKGKASVTENGERRTYSRQRLMLKQAVNKAAAGDLKALKICFELAHFYGLIDEVPVNTQDFTQSDKEILEDFLSRQPKTSNSPSGRGGGK
jgi:hypothetical protein